MKSKILLIEDDFDMQLVLKSILSRFGFEVFAASDRDMAWVKISQAAYRPDCIFMDLTVPGMAAEEFVGKLRTIAPPEVMPLILLTGWSDAKTIAKDLDVQEILSKPVDFELLRKTADKWCHKKL